MGMPKSKLEWQEYIKSNISQYRAKFREFALGYTFDETFVLTNDKVSHVVFSKPTQIIVLRFFGSFTVLLVFHDERFSDSEIRYEEFNGLYSLKISAIENALKDYAPNKAEALVSDILDFSSSIELGRWTLATVDNIGLIYLREQFPFSKYGICDALITFLTQVFEQERQRVNIQKTVREIKKDIKEIPTASVREKLLDGTLKLENEIGQLSTKLDKEIGGVRRLIGNTKEFQDFVVFSNIVTDLKNSHVPKEVFEARIEELSSRIDSFIQIREAYEKMLAKQNEFMQQQAEVMKQQSSFVQWIKYATILIPIAVISVPILEIVRALLGL